MLWHFFLLRNDSTVMIPYIFELFFYYTSCLWAIYANKYWCFFPVCTWRPVLLARISMNGVNIFVNELNFRFEIAVHIHLPTYENENISCMLQYKKIAMHPLANRMLFLGLLFKQGYFIIPSTLWICVYFL